MLTRTSQYAIRAMIYLTRQPGGRPIPGSRIAEDAAVPAKYMSKVLGDLVRAGLLESSPGKSGGFQILKPARRAALLAVVSPFERLSDRPCPFGVKECDEQNPCPVHDRWADAIESVQRFLRQTRIEDVAVRGNGEIQKAPNTQERD